MEESELTKVD